MASEDLALSVSLSLREREDLDSQLCLAVTLRVFVVDEVLALPEELDAQLAQVCIHDVHWEHRWLLIHLHIQNNAEMSIHIHNNTETSTQQH